MTWTENQSYTVDLNTSVYTAPDVDSMKPFCEILTMTNHSLVCWCIVEKDCTKITAQ